MEQFLPGISLPDGMLLWKAGIFTAVAIGSYYFQDLYNWMYWRRASELFSSILLGGGAALIALAVIYFGFPEMALERNALFIALVLTLGCSYATRALYLKLWFSSFSGSRVVILGDGEKAARLIYEFREGGYPVLFEGYVGENANPEIKCAYLGPPASLEKIIEEQTPDKLVVALDERRACTPAQTLLRIKLMLCEVTDASTLYEDYMGKISLDDIQPSSMIYAHGFVVSRFQDSVKRVFDVFFAITGIILSAPIMLVTAILIKLESPGPVFYLQDRLGQRSKEFKVIKFRSMRQDAEAGGPQWACQNDPRVTRVGKFIRKARIDELPQFFNVLKNDMSFVGPRPERKFFTDKLELLNQFYRTRLYVKPGITGWAQINFPYGDSDADALEKLKYELFYMKHRSLWLDLSIIFQTIKVAIKGRGSQ